MQIVLSAGTIYRGGLLMRANYDKCIDFAGWLPRTHILILLLCLFDCDSTHDLLRGVCMIIGTGQAAISMCMFQK
jgi:hypothetical protein